MRKEFYKNANIITYFLRSLISTTFMLSFIAKLYSFSEFANFISFIFNINNFMAIKLAALVLAIEFFISISILLFKESKPIYILTIVLTLLFTIFAIYLHVIDYTENCHCFGTYVKLNTLETLIKDLLLLIILFYLCKNAKLSRISLNELILLLVTVIGFLVIISKPIDYFRENVNSISMTELIKYRKVLFIDARNKDAYNKFHIPNAINIPFYYQKNISYNTLNKYLTDDNNITIVVYCDNKICTLSKELAKSIQTEFSRNKVYYLLEGLDGWLNY